MRDRVVSLFDRMCDCWIDLLLFNERITSILWSFCYIRCQMIDAFEVYVLVFDEYQIEVENMVL